MKRWCLILILFSSFAYTQTIDSTNIVQTNRKNYTLSLLIEHTLIHNKELKDLRLDYHKSRLEIKKAESIRYPKIDYQFSLTHIGNPMKAIYINPADFFNESIPGISSESVKIFDGMEDKYYQFKFIFDVPIFTWGKIENGIKISRLLNRIKKLQIRQKEKELKTKVRILVYSLKGLNQIEKILTQQKDISARLIYISEKSYESGFLIYTDVLNAKIKVKELDVAVAKIQESKNQALLDLRHTTEIQDLSMKNLFFEELSLNPEDYPPLSKTNLIQKALEKDLNLQVLQEIRKIAKLKILLAQNSVAFKPDIGIHSELTYGGSRFPLIETDWYGKDDYQFKLSFALSANLMDGFKQLTEIKLSQLDLTRADYQYQRGRDQIEQFISESFLKLDLNREKLEYYRLKIENDAEQIRSQKTQLEAGSGKESDYLSKELDRFKDQIDYYKELIDYFKNYFSLIAFNS